MTKTHSITGMILRTMSLGENDRFVTLYTEKKGKITCLAKGIRSIKSKRAGHIELLNCVQVELWKSKHHFYITQCHTIERFSEIKREMPPLASALFMSESLDRLTAEEDTSTKCFSTLENSLHLMNFYPEQHTLIREGFLIKLLNELGHMTSFRECSKCRNPFPGTAAYFQENENTLMCESCVEKENQYNRIPIDKGTLKLMNFIVKNPLENLFQVNLEQQHVEQMSQLGRVFLYKTLHHPLKTERSLHLY